MNANKMKAIVATGYGSPEVLKLAEVEIPQPKDNQILVKVHASSSTRADGMIRTGKPYFGRLIIGLLKPKHPIPGTGFAGVIVSIGSSVLKFNVGDAVFGETTTGFSTNAEYVVVNEDGVVLHKPENMRFEDAAPVCDGHLTSINFLKEIGNIKSGNKVLINGAAGSLGTAAVQLAKQMGAEVTGVCSTSNIGLVKSLGADHVIDYTKEDFTQTDERYDLVYDTVGKSSFRKSKRILKPNGAYLSPVLTLPLLLRMMRTSLTGKKKAKFGASGLKKDNELRALLEELVEMFRAGKLKTIIDRQFPLEKVAHAHEYIASGHKKGNVVIINQ